MKIINIVLLLFLLTSTSGHPEDIPIAVYDLRIIDFKLGMTYDEAVSVRAFHYTEFEEKNLAIGKIYSTFIEDVEFNTAVYFWNNSLFKIIARFDPKHFEQVTNSLKKALGPGTASSKTLKTINGTNVTQKIHKWIFPGARIDLIGISNNSDFATLSMRSTAMIKED